MSSAESKASRPYSPTDRACDLDLVSLVGPEMYTLWVSMLKVLGPGEQYAAGNMSVLIPMLEKLLIDAGLIWQRADHKGRSYSLADQALHDFFHWHDMPWE